MTAIEFPAGQEHDEFRRVLDDGVSSHATPSAVGAVLFRAHEKEYVAVHAAGHLYADVDRQGDEGAAATRETIYDLASLTKALSTTVIAIDAVAAGVLDLEATPFERWPDATIAQVLAHEAGLEAHREYFRPHVEAGDAGLLSTRQAIVASVLDTLPIAAAGTQTRYSDLGYIALGAYLEHALGAPLSTLFDRASQRHLGSGAAALRYVSLVEEGTHRAGQRVAPTEKCPWRGRIVQGQVHDDNAFAMGGIAGHAGLFGDVDAVLSAGRSLLLATAAATPFGRTLVAFLNGTGATHPGARPLGFDIATEGGTTGGALSARAFGHLGFTGTSLWIDPMDVATAGDGLTGAVYVLLTNRVHPSRDREGIGDLRRAFHQKARALVGTVALNAS